MDTPNKNNEIQTNQQSLIEFPYVWLSLKFAAG
jgi:hypothetical protein